MPKFVSDGGKLIEGWMFHCPACNTLHRIQVDKNHKPCWEWNRDVENPTVSPSILVRWSTMDKPNQKCHSFVKNGHIQFLGDCTHEYKNQTLEIPDWYDMNDWD